MKRAKSKWEAKHPDEVARARWRRGQRRRRARHRAAGLCTHCGQPRAEGVMLCQWCNDHANANSWKSRARNPAAGEAYNAARRAVTRAKRAALWALVREAVESGALPPSALRAKMPPQAREIPRAPLVV